MGIASFLLRSVMPPHTAHPGLTGAPTLREERRPAIPREQAAALFACAVPVSLSFQ